MYDLIVFLPLAGFLIAGVFGRWIGDRGAETVTSGLLGVSFVLSWIAFVQLAGMILLTAMIGAIVITLHHKAGVKRQDVGAQVARQPETAVELRKVRSRAGI